MYLIRSYASSRSIRAHIDCAKYEVVHCSNHKINGRAQGCSMFIVNKATGRSVYVTTDMVPQAYGVLLIRQAPVGDYSAGHNEYALSWAGFNILLEKLTK